MTTAACDCLSLTRVLGVQAASRSRFHLLRVGRSARVPIIVGTRGAARMAITEGGSGGGGGIDNRIKRISSAIRIIPDFPKPGIMFHDITTLLLDLKAFQDAIDLFVERYKNENISVVAGVEARGFIFGPPIALALGAKFVPLRKPKKLPGEVVGEEYTLEYGTDRIEMHVGAVHPGERAIVVDDLIATGGTLCAATRLLGNNLYELCTLGFIYSWFYFFKYSGMSFVSKCA
ncbi:Adenine phosphoribosyltransferase 1 [Nymphaea thermarum]|nr:Adenine phosphoribosyltransferase 1 [Nymphaea thermarum]